MVQRYKVLQPIIFSFEKYTSNVFGTAVQNKIGQRATHLNSWCWAMTLVNFGRFTLYCCHSDGPLRRMFFWGSRRLM